MRAAKAALFALLLVTAAPTLAQDQSAGLAEAEAARQAGDAARAITLLEPLAAERPGDADILRRLGASYAAAGRYDEAIATLERARTLAPADRDIALALARARLWSGDRGGARREADSIRAADPANAELPELLDSIAGAGARPGPTRGPTLSTSLGGSIVEVDVGGERQWLEAVLGASVPLGANTNLSSDVEHIDREFATDTRLSARLDHRLSDRTSLWLGGTATPDASFRERWSIRGGGEAAVTRNVSVLLDARHADYSLTSVTVAEPGLRVQWDEGRWAAQVRSINLFQDGEHRSGWSGRIERALPGDALLFAGAATYPDTEAGITRRVRGGYLGLALPVSEQFTLRVTADGERRAVSYDRFGLTVGLTWRPGR